MGNKNYNAENLTMAPYSNLKGAIPSLIENGRNLLIIMGFYILLEILLHGPAIDGIRCKEGHSMDGGERFDAYTPETSKFVNW